VGRLITAALLDLIFGKAGHVSITTLLRKADGVKQGYVEVAITS